MSPARVAPKPGLSVGEQSGQLVELQHDTPREDDREPDGRDRESVSPSQSQPISSYRSLLLMPRKSSVFDVVPQEL